MSLHEWQRENERLIAELAIAKEYGKVCDSESELAEQEIERLTADVKERDKLIDYKERQIQKERKRRNKAERRVADAEFVIRGLLYGPYTYKAERRGYKFLADTERERE